MSLPLCWVLAVLHFGQHLGEDVSVQTELFPFSPSRPPADTTGGRGNSPSSGRISGACRYHGGDECPSVRVCFQKGLTGTCDPKSMEVRQEG